MHHGASVTVRLEFKKYDTHLRRLAKQAHAALSAWDLTGVFLARHFDETCREAVASCKLRQWQYQATTMQL